MRHDNWVVRPDDHGIRPAGPRDACFYCHSLVGELHGSECVIPQRTVVLSASDWIDERYEFVVSVADCHDPETIEFLFNDHFHYLDALRSLVGPYPYNKCWPVAEKVIASKQIDVAYMREATALDEERSGVRLALSSSKQDMVQR